MKKLIATTAVMAFVAMANASISTSLVEIAGSPGYGTWDVQVTTVTDDWTAAGVVGTLSGSATFHNTEAFDPPNPPYYGDGMDTYFTCPAQYPNGAAFAGTTFAAGPVFAAQSFSGDWFDTNTNVDGTYTILRVTVDYDDVTPGILDLTGNVAAASTGGQLYPFSFQIPIPEPASLALLALGSLALIRRR